MLNNLGNEIKLNTIYYLTYKYIKFYNFLNILIFIFNFFRGAGQEVGRSCIMLEFKGKKIMVSDMH